MSGHASTVLQSRITKIHDNIVGPSDQHAIADGSSRVAATLAEQATTVAQEQEKLEKAHRLFGVLHKSMGFVISEAVPKEKHREELQSWISAKMASVLGQRYPTALV